MRKGIIKIIIAEDHNIVRQGLMDILSKYEDICVVGEAENGVVLIKKYESLKPDVVISDIEMPEMRGTEAAEEILKKDPKAKIVFLSMYNSDEYLYKIYKLGAHGLIPKEVILNELVEAIRQVNDGYKYFMGKSEREIDEIIEKMEIKKKNSPDCRAIQLTKKEQEVLLILAQGKTSGEIAEIFGNVGVRAIESHRASMMKKLNFTKAVELVRFAVQYAASLTENRKN